MTFNPSRRKKPRVSTDIETNAKPVRRNMFQARILNLSEGGAFIETQENLHIGSEVMLCMTLELEGKRKSCITQGKVVWIKRSSRQTICGWGVQFMDTPSSMRQTLSGYIRDLQGETSDIAKDVSKKQDARIQVLSRGQLRGG